MNRPETVNEGIRIRAAKPGDAHWIISLAPRLHEFGPPPWRSAEEMDASVAVGLAAGLATPEPGTLILAAVDDAGAPLGFISLRTDADYFTGKAVGHVTDIVVAPSGEGRGVGRALLGAAERWATAAGYPWLTLHVFEGNDRARQIYEKAGYVAEWTRMVKLVKTTS